ncbi:DUF6531 domain-containing protein [Sorangium sp. So ce1099]|uniref:DUF6531 domain-containing protein n=1 Tax=Sorangium sp. So ce1099 TaxID=3133331 RepID=UPI003F5F5760
MVARTAPVPNIPAIPGMNPGVFIMGGGGSGGGGNGRGGKGNADGQGGNGQNGGNGANGGGKNANACGPGSGAGCPNPKHGGGGTHAGDPVDPISGRVYTVAVVDLALPGVGLPLTIARSYSSASLDEDVGLGPGWSHSLAFHIEERRASIVVHEPAAAPTRAPRPEVGTSVLLPCGTLHRTSWGYALQAGGRTLSFGERSGGRLRLSRIADANGNAIHLVYRDGRLAQIVDSAGRVVRVRYHGGRRIAAFEVHDLGEGRWLSFWMYAYDEAGHLVAATDAKGHATRYAYDDAHRLLRRVEPGGLTVEFRYDKEGRCVETWCHRDGNDALDSDAPAVLRDGTPAKGFLHVKLQRGDDFTEVATSRGLRRVHGNRFDKADMLTFNGGVGSYQYDSGGNLTEYADPLNHVFRAERDDGGRLLATVDPLGARVEYRYDERGFVCELLDALGHATRYARDARGNVTAIDDDRGHVVTLRYDEWGQIVEGILPDGSRTRMAYDAMGNRVEVVEPDGSARRIHYNYLGRVLSFTDARGLTTSYSYDACGRVTSVQLPSGAALRYTYDPDGNLASITDADGRATLLRCGGYHVVTEVVRPDGSTVRFRYDREQELVRVINESGDEHRLDRSGEGRIGEERTFDGRVIGYVHDVPGQLTQVRRELGLTELAYDPVGRLIERKHADNEVEAFAYDLSGRIVSSSSGDVVCDYAHDARGNVALERVTHAGRVVQSETTFDALGRPVRRQGPGGVVEVRRDAMGRPVEVWYGDTAPLRQSYDAAGFEVERALPQGGCVVSEASPDGLVARTTVLGPVRAPRVGQGEPAWVGPLPRGVTYDRKFTWSPGGRLRAADELVHGGRTELDRDANGRVVAFRERVGQAARLELFGYSPSGDASEPSAPRRYGSGGRPLARGGMAYAHDPEGRVIEKRIMARRSRWKSGGTSCRQASCCRSRSGWRARARRERWSTSSTRRAGPRRRWSGGTGR